MIISNKLISEIGAKEKYIRAQHYNSIKVWWARRPIRAARAILINEIVARKGKDLNVNSSIVHDINPTIEELEQFKSEYNTSKISVLDVFAGGGSIPFEAGRLGCKTYSAELNPIASLLQETIFNAHNFPKFHSELKKVGQEIISKAEARLKNLYSFGSITPYTVFWGKTLDCTECGTTVSLSRLKYLSKRKTKIIAIENGELVSNPLDSEEAPSKVFHCSKCNEAYTFSSIKNYCKTNTLGSMPLAICYHEGSKKLYKAVNGELLEAILEKESWVEKELENLNHLIPNELVDRKNGVINPTIYDLKKPQHFFNRRQLLVLLVLIDEVSKEYTTFEKKYKSEYAKQLILGLTSLIEFLVDWNSNGTMWISQNEQSGRSLAGPGVGMKWDYLEINPFYRSGSNLNSKLERVCSTLSAINLTQQISIINGSSAQLPLADKSIDIVLADPPYFDSIDYTALSEFFRPWFETLIKNTYDKNSNLKNNTSKEAIVQLGKGKEDHRGSDHYKSLMTQIFVEVKRVLKDDGKFIFMYSHKTIEGWEVIAEAIKDANLYVSLTYPLDMERAARPRGMSSQALNGVIIFELTKSKQNLVAPEILSRVVSSATDFEVSHLPIYIASLACQYFTLTNESFENSYSLIRKAFDLEHYSANQDKEIDKLVGAYLLSVRTGVDSLKKSELDLLKKNNLLDEQLNIKGLMNILETDLKFRSETFLELLKIFNEHKYNSATKIFLDKALMKNASFLFNFLSGSELNTVKARSFDNEKKISRLIMSKISEV